MIQRPINQVIKGLSFSFAFLAFLFSQNSLFAQNGGSITFADGQTIISICVGDGIPNPLDVITTGGQVGESFSWVITDPQKNIVALPDMPPFDLEPAGPGTCLIWYLAYNGTISGLNLGMNVDSVVGAFDLSNGLTVGRDGVSGGLLTTTEGETELNFCPDDGISDAFNISLTGNSGTDSYWIVTDPQGEIIGLPAGPPFDFEGAGPGICQLWFMAVYDSVTGVELGSNVSGIEGCHDFSNPIILDRNGPDPGLLSWSDGSFSQFVCVDGVEDSLFTQLDWDGSTTSLGYIVTDIDDNILDLTTSTSFDFDAAGVGICFLSHAAAFDAAVVGGLEVGNNLTDITGCIGLSNKIKVERWDAEGGELSLVGGGTAIDICAGDGSSDAFDVTLTGDSGQNSGWVITDSNLNILALPTAPPFDLEGAGAGICLIWHISYSDDLSGLEVGQNANDFTGCFDLSNQITVNRTGITASTIAITGSGDTAISICAGDGASDAFDVTLTGATAANEAWVITDSDLNILDLPLGPPFDLEGAGAGVCLIWHLSYENNISGATIGANAANLEGCYALSNSIAVTRTLSEGGEIEIVGGGTTIDICAGDGISDEFDVTLTGNGGENETWIITNGLGEILALPTAPPFDLEGAGDGVCFLWHLAYDDATTGLEVGLNSNDLMGCYDVSNSIQVTRTGVDGGAIETLAGETTVNICAGDGVSDAFEVNLTGNSGANSAWVITDSDANILDLPVGPPFDLEGAGIGTCSIWHLSFETGLVGAEVGLSTNDLEGCFSLSNPITVIRSSADGGELALVGGGVEIDICAGDGISDAFDVVLTGFAGENLGWLITDANGEILALPTAPPFDLEGAGAGTCLVWHISYANAVTGIEVGGNASTIEGCYELSNAIIVNRTGVAGGMLTTAAGETELFVCAGDGTADPFDVNLTEEAGTNSAWVITDSDLNILDLPTAPPFDLDGAGTGVCLLWHLSFEDGLTGAAVGENAGDLDGCYSLSNSITVTRSESLGGDIALADGSTEISICAGDGVSDAFDVELTGNDGTSSGWLITDANLTILGLPASPPFDLEAAGAGECLIWHISYGQDLEGLTMGANAGDMTGCFDLSNSITVNRTGVVGGTLAIEGGATEITICAGDSVADPFNVTLVDTLGTNFAWVITNEAGEILELPAAPPFDLEGAGVGVCLIWALSFEDGLVGAEVGQNANDLEGCFALSNSITVTRVDSGPDCFVGTKDLVDNTAFQFYPNPTNGQLTIYIGRSFNGELNYRILDVTGKEVMFEQGYDASKNMDISILSEGIYFLEISNKDFIGTQKLIKY